MSEAILNGLVAGIGISLVLALIVIIKVCGLRFKDYVPTLVFTMVAKETPFWYMVGAVTTLCVVASLANWGFGHNGVTKLAVAWGVVMYFGTFVLYRGLWAISVAGMNVSKWDDVWKLTKTKGNVHRKADQKISFIILVMSVLLTTWMAVQGVYG
jgi:hypothetical protein